MGSSGKFSITRFLSRKSSKPAKLTNSALNDQVDPNAPPPYSACVKDAENPPCAFRRPTIDEDDEYSFLARFDTLFLIDDSGSMAGRCWSETRVALEKITPVCTKYDSNGVDILFLNDPAKYENVRQSGAVSEIFDTVSPSGTTPVGERLDEILSKYLRQFRSKPKKTKPLNIIVITDGQPTDDPESVIVRVAKKLDKLNAPPWQVGIQFFQVGNDYRAQQYLQYLDDSITSIGGKDIRDIVDTVPFSNIDGSELSGDGILKCVLGAVNRRLDRMQPKFKHN